MRATDVPVAFIGPEGRFADELSEAVRNGQSAKSVETSEIARSSRVALFHLGVAASTLKIQLRRIFSRQ
jgi:hypothetical protein